MTERSRDGTPPATLLSRLRRRFGGTQATGAYRCDGCGRLFDVRRQVCPDCGGYDIDRVEWQTGDE